MHIIEIWRSCVCRKTEKKEDIISVSVVIIIIFHFVAPVPHVQFTENRSKGSAAVVFRGF